VAALQSQPARIQKGITPFFDLRRNHVARNPRLIVHDRNALPRQPVEEPALADIGSADDGNGAVHTMEVLAKVAKETPSFPSLPSRDNLALLRVHKSLHAIARVDDLLVTGRE